MAAPPGSTRGSTPRSCSTRPLAQQFSPVPSKAWEESRRHQRTLGRARGAPPYARARLPQLPARRSGRIPCSDTLSPPAAAARQSSHQSQRRSEIVPRLIFCFAAQRGQREGTHGSEEGLSRAGTRDDLLAAERQAARPQHRQRAISQISFASLWKFLGRYSPLSAARSLPGLKPSGAAGSPAPRTHHLPTAAQQVVTRRRARSSLRGGGPPLPSPQRQTAPGG